MAHCPNGPVFSLADGGYLVATMARSRSLRSKQARSQRPDRFREGYLVNVNLQSDVLTRSNRARIYGCDIYIYMHLLDCPFNALLLRVHVWHSCTIWETRFLWDIACSFSSPSSIFKFSLTQIPRAFATNAETCVTDAPPAKYVIS